MPITVTITNNSAEGDPIRLYLDSSPTSVSTAGQEVPPGETVTVQSDYPLRGSITAQENTNWTVEVENGLVFSSIILRIENAGANIRLSVTGPNGEHKGTSQRPKLEPGDRATSALTGLAYLFTVPA